jgi:crotonobetainyl-CoA:carnitine CoA-transferase CaiB-like acyl-CoA transferase
MAPHGIYPAHGDDEWVAIACRDDADWRALAGRVDAAWTREPRFADLAARIEHQDALDDQLAAWTRECDKFETAAVLQAAGVPATAVQKPEERIDKDPNTKAWGLWPTVEHTAMGSVRVDGLPVHHSVQDWEIERGAPCLGEHNDRVFGEILGLSASELSRLRDDGVI